MRSKTILACVLALSLSAAIASAGERWLHVRVQDAGDEETVSVNIPLQLVESILPTIRTDELHDGRIHLGRHAELDDLDLREMLAALRDAPDAEFVTVRSRDENVRVAKEKGMLLIHADDAEGERVRVRMPLEVIEAMLGAGEDELDLIAALRALAKFDGHELVTVESDDSLVRIWIDSSESGE